MTPRIPEYPLDWLSLLFTPAPPRVPNNDEDNENEEEEEEEEDEERDPPVIREPDEGE